MTTSRVFKIPQSDNDQEFVLLQASSSAGKKPLDLKLIATEGEAPYVVKSRSSTPPSKTSPLYLKLTQPACCPRAVKHDRIAALKVQNSPLTDSEWESTLESFFSQKPLSVINATATVQSETSITITIRKQVQGITVKFPGSSILDLSHDENQEIELLQWCAASADAVVASNAATAQAQSTVTELEAAIQKLKEQLEELLKAKDEDETALLQKFRDLLNEKKVKIREQQKVLASGTFAAAAAQEPEPEEQSPEPEPSKGRSRARKPAASRARKRKAPAPIKEEEESDGGDAAEEEPRIKSEPEDTEDGGNTTEATASVDGDEDDSDEKMADDSGRNEQDKAATSPPPREPSPPKKAAAAPPPKRDLPFANRKPKEAPPKAVVPADGAATDSDDEL
ncbi:DNA double-strand break repair and VJ recombination XRCC4 [Cordyceps fumosorosea ARSEF 2679]|uniref:DNA double-strand break repair and VJ recombination XRCC4 n=1 Tax=Cordyceps fumosorosea (strain ARSEF 2679) TaxID=1081104 RepID=A0A167SAM9_CORFA|nr:DNA double-strand break repair and VJ recombination XRCC4 [Cordyceps fumosorosea ARSEF 2679]OAA59430.1 DNA double-strand break repair and VJ recombination XRCC4 [Cordyceps fumosorosea ARSEF 2679]